MAPLTPVVHQWRRCGTVQVAVGLVAITAGAFLLSRSPLWLSRRVIGDLALAVSFAIPILAFRWWTVVRDGDRAQISPPESPTISAHSVISLAVSEALPRPWLLAATLTSLVLVDPSLAGAVVLGHGLALLAGTALLTRWENRRNLVLLRETATSMAERADVVPRAKRPWARQQLYWRHRGLSEDRGSHLLESTSQYSIAAARERRQQREASLAMARKEPELAQEVGLGRPDLPGACDGGVVDVNSVPVTVLATLPYVDEVMAEQIVVLREQLGGFQSIEDLGLVADLPARTVEALRTRAIFLPHRY
jgi:DNA uptake protein ComE-like DNA-binding protein